MTERAAPNGQSVTMDVLHQDLLQFGDIYHNVQRSLDQLLTRIDAHDEESKRERAVIRDQITTLQRHVDRRFDALGREIDQIESRLQVVEVELRQHRIEALTRLDDHDHRIAALETEMAELRTLLRELLERLATEDAGDGA